MQIELTEGAIMGVGPANCMAAVQQLPTTVCLGQIRSKAQPACLKLSSYMNAPTLPSSINRRDKAAAGLARMYANDRYGNCVIAGMAHSMGVWSVHDDDSPGEVIATDQEIVSQYQSFCGPGDRGCNIANVLNIVRSKGIVLGGKKYTIDGYVSVDNTKKELVKAALYFFGSLKFGIDLPQAWTSNAIWDVTNSRTVGGHDVTGVDYDDDEGVYISSWGRIYVITWPAMLSTRYVTELYAMLAPLWYGANNIAGATGIDIEGLKADLKKIESGIVPDVIDPMPPGPEPAPNTIRLLKDVSKGKHGDMVLGSDLAAGDYDAILLGEEGGPPPIP